MRPPMPTYPFIIPQLINCDMCQKLILAKQIQHLLSMPLVTARKNQAAILDLNGLISTSKVLVSKLIHKLIQVARTQTHHLQQYVRFTKGKNPHCSCMLAAIQSRMPSWDYIPSFSHNDPQWSSWCKWMVTSLTCKRAYANTFIKLHLSTSISHWKEKRKKNRYLQENV